MAEYIDKAVVLSIHEPPKSNRRYQTNNLDDAYGQGWDDALYCIEQIPAANVVPAVQGWWERRFCHPMRDGEWQYICSICKDDNYWRDNVCHQKHKYCPNCGAKMQRVE